MTEAGLTLTDQPRLSTLATVTLDDTAHRLWQRITRGSAFQNRFVDAVGEVIGGLHTSEQVDRLREIGVDALGGVYAGMLPSLAEGGERAVDALAMTRQFGSPSRTTAGWHASLDELADGPLAVFGAVDTTPTIAFEMDGAFWNLRADQREDVCDLLGMLARGFDVRVVAGGLDQRKLAEMHHEHLPGVSHTCTAPRDSDHVAAVVKTARADLATDGRETEILRSIAGTPGETVSYTRLYAMATVDDSRVRQVLRALDERDLVGVFGPNTDRKAELLEPGREYLDTIDAELGRQQELDACVSDPPNPSDDIRVSPEPPSREAAPPNGGGGGGGRGSGWVSVEYLSRHEHVAAVAAASGADIGVSDHPIEGAGRSPLFSYDEKRDEVVAGAEFMSPLQWCVCTARALASGQMFEQVLTTERLDAGENLAAVFEGDRELATRAAQLGWLSGDEEGAADYTERLQDTVSGICADTAEYRAKRDAGEDEDADELARSIIRRSQGLIGIVTRLLDCCDVDFVRYMQIPEYAADFHTSENHRRRRSILKTIAKTSTIGGNYGAYTAERTMYEPRADKREFALGAPNVTIGENGSLMGSWTLTGRGVSKLLDPADGPSLRSALRSPGELQEDGTNYAVFDVPLTIQTDRRREAMSAAVRRLCDTKNMRPTPEATSYLAACCGSVLDVTRALNHLGAEPADRPRPIKLDEVRRALATVPENRLLADTPSRSAGATFKAMIDVQDTLTQSELANRAGVSTQTIRNNTEVLEALSLVERTPGENGTATEWRFALPARDERHTRGRGGLYRETGVSARPFERMVRSLTEAIAPPEVVEAFGTEIRDLNTLIERCPDLKPWLQHAVLLDNRELDPETYADLHTGEQQSTGYGEAPMQASLGGAAMGVAD